MSLLSRLIDLMHKSIHFNLRLLNFSVLGINCLLRLQISSKLSPNFTYYGVEKNQNLLISTLHNVFFVSYVAGVSIQCFFIFRCYGNFCCSVKRWWSWLLHRQNLQTPCWHWSGTANNNNNNKVLIHERWCYSDF